MPEIKKYQYDFDLDYTNQIKNFRIHNVDVVAMATLAGLLGLDHKGLMIWHTDGVPYWWDGTKFISFPTLLEISFRVGDVGYPASGTAAWKPLDANGTPIFQGKHVLLYRDRREEPRSTVNGYNIGADGTMYFYPDLYKNPSGLGEPIRIEVRKLADVNLYTPPNDNCESVYDDVYDDVYGTDCLSDIYDDVYDDVYN